MHCSNWWAWQCNKLPSHVDNYRIIQVKFLAWYYGSSRCRDCRCLLILCRKPNISSPLWALPLLEPMCFGTTIQDVVIPEYFLKLINALLGNFGNCVWQQVQLRIINFQGWLTRHSTQCCFFPSSNKPFWRHNACSSLSLSIHGDSVIPSLCRHGMIFDFSFKVF